MALAVSLTATGNDGGFARETFFEGYFSCFASGSVIFQLP